MKYKFVLCLIPLLALVSCNPKGHNSVSIDKTYPEASDLAYNDYFETTEYDLNKYFYNSNH